MSDKRYPYADAMKVAEEIQRWIEPYCEPNRCVIVGSLRRQKEAVGDIELLYVSRMGKPVKTDMFAPPNDIPLVEPRIDCMQNQAGILRRRLNIRGHETWGPKNKLAVHVASGIPVDLFATSEENWYVSLVIRTGSKETNLKLTNGAIKRGGTLHAYGSGVQFGLATTRATSERHVFELCGIPYIPLTQR